MDLAISIVSHGHGGLLTSLLESLVKVVPRNIRWEVILTHNIPEDFSFDSSGVKVTQVHNLRPRGFSTNHNCAFERSEADYFCILNPDVALCCDPFGALIEILSSDPSICVVGPHVANSQGGLEMSARAFPGFFTLLKKFVGFGEPSVAGPREVRPVPWLGGMFLLMRSSGYRLVSGFDEAFFLYYEDVDICGRCWLKGLKVVFCGNTEIVHDGRRESHYSFRFFRWHALSFLRYYFRRLRYIKAFRQFSG